MSFLQVTRCNIDGGSINRHSSRGLTDGVKSTENMLSEQLYKLESVIGHQTVEMMDVNCAR